MLLLKVKFIIIAKIMYPLEHKDLYYLFLITTLLPISTFSLSKYVKTTTKRKMKITLYLIH